MKKSCACFALTIIAFASQLNAQDEFTNPFFREPHFFLSGFETSVFKKLEHDKTNQTPEPLAMFMTFFSENAENEILVIKRDLKKLCLSLENRKHKNEMAYLRKIFAGVHRTYLKKYQRYATFDRIFLDGSFDCLTGTALYAMVLEQLGFPCIIHETSLHSYLTVYANNSLVLFETTDPLEGFITQRDIIEARQEQYSREIAPDFADLSGLTGFKNKKGTIHTFNKTIGLKELAGLHYYNQAVIKYNIRDYRAAVQILEKASVLYPSKRIFYLLLNAVQLVLKEKNISRYDVRKYSGKNNYYTGMSEKFN